MKKIVLILTLAFAAGTVQAQFPTTDSLRKYINKYIRNTAIEAFTNLRLNTAMIGSLKFVDSAYGGQVKSLYRNGDSVYLVTLKNDTFRISAAQLNSTIAKGGIHKSGDTIKLGGAIDTSARLVVRSARRNSPTDSLPTSFVISNSPTTNVDSDINGQQRPTLYMIQGFGDNDTLNRQYGGVDQGVVNSSFTENNKRWVSTPLILPYQGAYRVSRVLASDTTVLQVGPFGGVPSAYAGDLALGNNWPTYLDIRNAVHPYKYPLTAMRLGIDLARRKSDTKREINGIVSGYTFDYRDYQASITSGTTEDGSKTGRMHAFDYFGDIYFNTAATKSKYLAVSTVDTVAAYHAWPVYNDSNTVNNGYGIWAEGKRDFNHFGGYLSVGGDLPTRANMGAGRRFSVRGTAEISDTTFLRKRLIVGNPAVTSDQYTAVVDSSLRVGDFVDNNSNLSVSKSYNGITSATIGGIKPRQVFITQSNSYDENVVELKDKFSEAMFVQMVHRVGALQDFYSSFGHSAGQAATIGTYYRKKTGYTGTSIFRGAGNFFNSPAALVVRMDVARPQTSDNNNIFQGKFSVIQPVFEFNDYNRIEHGAFINIGSGQYGSLGSGFDTVTGIQLQQLPFTFSNARYAINQVGTADSVILNGPVRMPARTVQNDTSVYKPAVFDALGNLVKMDGWKGSGGGGGGVSESKVADMIKDSLDNNGFVLLNAPGPGDSTLTFPNDTTGQAKRLFAGAGIGRKVDATTIRDSIVLPSDQIPWGLSGVYNSSSALTYNGTAFKQENSGAKYSLINTGSLGSTGGGNINAFTKLLPTAADQQLGWFGAGSMNNSTTETVTAGIGMYSNAGWSFGSSHQTYMDFFVTASNTQLRVMRATHNGRLVIGGTTANGYLSLKAGDASVPSLYIPSGTDMTTPTTGSFSFSSGRFKFVPSGSTYKSAVFTNDVAPSVGQVAVGNGVDYTLSDFYSIQTATTTSTITLAATVKMVTVKADATAGNITLTVTANHIGQVINFIKTNTSNTVTLAASSGSLLYGVTSLATQGEGEHYQWDGTNWLALP